MLIRLRLFLLSSFPLHKDKLDILTRLLYKFQVHKWKHSPSFFKKTKRLGDCKCCRFLIPQLLRNGRLNGNQYLNPYIKLIAEVFKCNHDIKFLFEGSLNMAYYCLKYATKTQKEVEDLLNWYFHRFQKACNYYPLSSESDNLSNSKSSL